MTIKKSKIKDQKSKNNKSNLKTQNSKPQLKTLKLTFCHPEGSRSVILNEVKDPMTNNREILR